MVSESKIIVPGHNSISEKDPRKDTSGRKEIVHFWGERNNWDFKDGSEIAE